MIAVLTEQHTLPKHSHPESLFKTTGISSSSSFSSADGLSQNSSAVASRDIAKCIGALFGGCSCWQLLRILTNMRPILIVIFAISSTLLIVIALLSHLLAFQFFNVPSGAMVPAIAPSDLVLIKKWGYNNTTIFGHTVQKKAPSVAIKRGQVLVFKRPPYDTVNYIFRVIGLPDDTIGMVAGKIILNNESVPQELISSTESITTLSETIDDVTYTIQRENNRSAKETQLLTVPENHIFVLGDNRDRANDSRYWGFVPFENIVGLLVGTIKTSKLKPKEQ